MIINEKTFDEAVFKAQEIFEKQGKDKFTSPEEQIHFTMMTIQNAIFAGLIKTILFDKE